MRYVPDAEAMWRSDRGLSAMLVFIVLAIFVASPLVSLGIVPGFVMHAAFCLLFLSGVFATFHRRAIGWITTALVAGAIAVRSTHVVTPRHWLAVATEVFTIVLLAVLTALVFKQVFRAGPVTSHRIQGAIVVYMLIGLVWSSAYQLLEILQPGSFQVPVGGLGLHSEVLGYFSFVTLTTVGYGDVTAIHPIARSLAIAEALIGQLYPAILIARLVSLELISKTSREPYA